LAQALWLKQRQQFVWATGWARDAQYIGHQVLEERCLLKSKMY